MNDSGRGWLFVAIQAALLGALIFVPGRADWPTPPWLRAIGYGIFLVGITAAAVAALGLGRSLTPTPVPSPRGELTTAGLYRWVRHPIYTGVLTIVVALTIRSGSWVHVAIAVVTFVFFDRKARWEEQRLAERYDGYPAYASVTPRFFPQPWSARPF